jgi:hypothetical protein
MRGSPDSERDTGAGRSLSQERIPVKITLKVRISGKFAYPGSLWDDTENIHYRIEMLNPTVNVLHVFSRASHWFFDQTLM